jgi:hypothetical protein
MNGGPNKAKGDQWPCGRRRGMCRTCGPGTIHRLVTVATTGKRPTDRGQQPADLGRLVLRHKCYVCRGTVRIIAALFGEKCCA